jgi:hypothetical protein
VQVKFWLAPKEEDHGTDNGWEGKGWMMTRLGLVPRTG